MWKQYRKTFVPIQLTILTICLVGYFYVGLPIRTDLFYFMAMQICSVIGARWAVRLQGKVEASKTKRGQRKLLV